MGSLFKYALWVITTLCALLAVQGTYFESPAGSRFAKINYDGETVLPNGRLLTPLGSRLYTRDNLWRIELSPNERTAVGLTDSGLSIFDLTEANPKQKSIAYKDGSICGTFSADGTKYIMGGGETGDLVIYDTSSWEISDRITLKDAANKDPFVIDLALTKRGDRLYALDIAHQRVVTIDLAQKKAIGSEKAGRQPYAMILSPDEKHLYVANIGIFDYSLIKKPEAGKGNPRGLSFPPFGFPSPESEKGVKMEGRDVDGIGSPQAPDAQSIWRYDLASPNSPSVDRKVKTGILIHAQADSGKAVGGSAPNALAFVKGQLLVTNANNDTLQVFDQNCKLLKTVKFVPQPLLRKLRGVMPTGISFDPKSDRVYVCATGLNAMAVLNASTYKVQGYFPTAWWPISSTVAKDGSLFVANSYGIGIGPRGPNNPRLPEDERYNQSGMPGIVSKVQVPKALEALSQQVLKNNGLIPTTNKPEFPKEIKHVVFITKENHTFDGIFGELKGAKGEPDYAEHGMNGWIDGKNKETRLPIMPNHIRLAEQFGVSDNFYMEVGASGAGHRWLVGAYASLWTSRVYYSGWNFRPNNDAKGRLVSFGSNGSQIPEDYLENGSMWEHLGRNNISFRNYGEGFEFAASDEGEPFARSGVAEVVNFPMPKILYDNTCREFPIYNTNIPDIARADWFKDDIKKNFRDKKKPLPKFMNIAICNDHGADPKPKFGYHSSSSYLADNDMALGQIVEYLSHTPEWKNMAIFVTQDDAGGDNDHIDRHRSFALCISPYAKKGYVSHVHTSIMSIIKSIYGIFGLGPNNMFDAVVSPLDDMFTSKPDFTPYNHVAADRRVFRPEETIDPTDPTFKKRRAMASAKMDSKEWFEWLEKQRASGGN